MTGEHVLIGVRPVQPGAHCTLMLRLADQARALGFERTKVEGSRIPTSRSRYLTFQDRFARPWKVRVSDHFRPARAATPHFDLVSLDGVAGLVEASEFLARVAAGTVSWFDVSATLTRVPFKLRRRIGR